jgi:hypothetical protein
MSIHVAGCLWCIAGSNWTSFGSKIAKSAPLTRRNSLLAKYFANSKILQTTAHNISLLAQLAAVANMLLACWLILGPMVHSEAFLSSFYNLITPKQHLSNAHNIK